MKALTLFCWTACLFSTWTRAIVLSDRGAHAAVIDSANSSSSYDFVNSDFEISYVDGSGASGDYATDTISIGGIDIEGLQFGIGYRSASPEGVLGIGYAINEAQVQNNGQAPYDNLPQVMVKRGLIRSNAYSLWLNDYSASTGEILFGGVNTEKYIGDLATLPIQLSRGSRNPRELIITLTGLGATQGGNQQTIASNRADPVLLDSGASISYLPDDIFSNIRRAVDAQYSPSLGSYVVDCALSSSTSTMDFEFSGVVIKVPFDELVTDPGPDALGQRLTLDGSTPACLFGLIASGGQSNVLGDSFLRSAYVVYDLDNNEISLAQTNFNSTEDDIREIGTGPDAVPNSTPVDNPVTATGSQEGGRLGGPGSGSGSGFTYSPRPTANAAAASFEYSPLPALGLFISFVAFIAV
ncbi:MAG: hypothetical protein M1825_003681 [Sarcosagium campestre]|nr:MAG: hypothetical protein M1825_003681 [Sarcosagium campestre]